MFLIPKSSSNQTPIVFGLDHTNCSALSFKSAETSKISPLYIKFLKLGNYLFLKLNLSASLAKIVHNLSRVKIVPIPVKTPCAF